MYSASAFRADGQIHFGFVLLCSRSENGDSIVWLYCKQIVNWHNTVCCAYISAARSVAWAQSERQSKRRLMWRRSAAAVQRESFQYRVRMGKDPSKARIMRSKWNKRRQSYSFARRVRRTLAHTGAPRCLSLHEERRQPFTKTLYAQTFNFVWKIVSFFLPCYIVAAVLCACV